MVRNWVLWSERFGLSSSRRHWASGSNADKSRSMSSTPLEPRVAQEAVRLARAMATLGGGGGGSLSSLLSVVRLSMLMSLSA